jgi:putative Mg2+ transporter-C (MgtC) family protein
MPIFDLAQRLLLAAGLAAAIGLEREYRQKPAGLRTNMLIGLGSALFTMISTTMAVGGSDRIAAQVVTGVGFLGGGAILRSGNDVHGMTTAATIWVNAAIGMAAGAGQFALATATTVLTLVVLAVLAPAEEYFDRRMRMNSGNRPPPDSRSG